MGAGRAIGLGCVLLVLAVGVGSLAAPGGALHDSSGPAQQDIDADTVSLRLDLQESGSAVWRVTYRIELDDENATAAFESLQSDIESDPGPYVDRFETRMRRAMWTAENATGRDMTVGNVSVEARTESLPQGEYGVVAYRLDWTNFAVVEDDTIRAGDAIDEFFLDGQTSLTVAWPDRYGLAAHEPGATTVDDGSLTWQGRLDFGPGEPRVEVVRGAGETPGAGGLPVMPIVLVVAVVLLTGGWLYVRRDGAAPTAEDGPGEAPAGAATEGEDGPPPELLSNEERVLRLLEQHGGRIKQQQVAEELDWTDAKTSQVVSDLRESDDMESFRLGRENVLTLPDVSIEGGTEEASPADADGDEEVGADGDGESDEGEEERR